MIGRTLAAYLAGWCVVVVVLFVVLTRFSAAWFGFDDRTILVTGVATAAVVDLAVFVLVVLGLVRWPRNFFLLWGASELLKVVGFCGVGGWLASATSLPVRSYCLVAVTAFVAFTHHEVFALYRLGRNLERNGADKKAQSEPAP